MWPEPTVDVITFNGPSTITLTDDEIFISEALKLQGPVTIDGGGQTRSKRIFRTVGDHPVTFIGIKFQNAWDGGGGAILNLGASLTFDASQFTQNKAITSDGGALNSSGGGIVFVQNTTFDHNESQAGDGGAVWISGSDTNATFKGVTFDTNTAFNSAGALYMTGSATDGIFFVVDSSDFKSNESTNNDTNGGGGAIFNATDYNENTVIKLSTFEGNKATNGKGGALYNSISAVGAVFQDSVFHGNFATGQDATQGFGGAIWNQGDLLLNRVTLDANNATMHGAGIANKATSGNPTVIANSTITGNIAATVDSRGGGVWNDSTGSLTTKNTTIAENIALLGLGSNVYDEQNGEIILQNTIIANGSGASSCDGLGKLTNNNGDGNVQWPGTGCDALPDPISSGDPKLGGLMSAGPPTGSQVYPLGAGSAATSAGNASVCAADPVSNLDQTNATRPQPSGTNCDSGSFESPRAAGYDSNPAPGQKVTISTDTQNTGSGKVTVSETGTDDLIVSDVQITGDSQITLTSATSFTIQDGGSDVDITFDCTSNQANTYNATLQVTHNGGNSPASYPIECDVSEPAQPGYGSVPSPGSSILLATTFGIDATQNIVISETGGATLTGTVTLIAAPLIASISLTAGEGPFSIPDGGPPVTVTVKCSSNSNTQDAALISVTHNASGSPALYPVACDVEGPSSPIYESLPTPGSSVQIQTAPNQAQTTDILVTNLGTDDLNVTNVQLSGDPNITLVSPSTFTIGSKRPPKDITLQCLSGSSGDFSTTVTVTHNAPGSPATYTVNCHVTGNAISGYSSNPPPGSTVVIGTDLGNTGSASLPVSESGSAELDVTNVALSGDAAITLTSPTSFSIADGGPPQSIDMDCSSSFIGTYHATLTVTHNANGSPSTYNVVCNVTATAAPVYVSSPPPDGGLDLSFVAGGSKSGSITVSEGGTAQLDITNVQLSGDPEITLTTPTSFSIVDGGPSQDVTVQCASGSAGSFSSTLTITHNAPGSPASYTIDCNVSSNAAPGYGSSPIGGSTLTLGTTPNNPTTTNVTVSETGTATLVVSNVAVTGDPEITLTTASSFQILDGGPSQDITVQCSSSQTGTFNATLTVTHNASGSPATYPVQCDVTAAPTPGYDSNPTPGSTLSLGTTPNNPTTTNVAVSETGSATLVVSNVAVTGDPEITLTTPSSFQILDGGLSQNITVQCSSSSTGSFNATLTVTHNASGSPATYPVQCNVTPAPAPGYGSNPIPGSTLSLGTTPNNPTTTNVTVSETGSATLVVSNVAVAGDPEITLTTASSFQILDGGLAQNVTVQCSSSSTGSFTATLTVTHNASGSPATYPVQCNVTPAPAPGYGSNPVPGSTLSLGTTPNNPTTTNVTVSETGSATLVVSNVAVTGDPEITLTTASSFQIVDGGGSQNVTVQCSSSQTGSFTATLTVTHNASGSPATYPVQCNVTAAPTPGYGSSPNPGSTLSLSTTPNTPTSTSVTVSETGSATLVVSNVAVTGDPEITLTTASSFQIVDGGGSQNVTVQCSSSQNGSFTATLTVTHNASGSPATYPIQCDVAAAGTPGYSSLPTPGSQVTIGTTVNVSAIGKVVVSETGNATLIASSVVVTGDPQITLKNASSFQILDGGASFTSKVQCVSSQTGTFNATLTITHNASGSPATYPVQCNVTAVPTPGYGSNPTPGTSLPMNTVVNTPTTTKVTVSETGSALLDVTNVAVSGDAPITLASASSFQIPDGSPSVDITVQCSSAQTGTFNATLTVTHNASGSPATYPVQCTVNGVPTPGFGSNPPSGTQLVIGTIPNVVAKTKVSVSETGTATLVASSVTVTGDPEITLKNASSFQIPDGGAPFKVRVQCVSSQIGQFNATLTITHNASGSPASYPVQCNVTAAPTPGYGSAPVPGSTIPLTTAPAAALAGKVTVSETGSALLDVTNVGLSGDPEITLTSASSFQIADGGNSQDITFQCLSASPGTFTSALTVTHNATGSPAQYTIDCTVQSPGGGNNVANADFNGDGLPDLIFEQPSTGSLIVWFMNGPQRLNQRPLDPDHTPGPTWHVVGSGDFNGDQKADLLLRESTTGALKIWYMNGVHKLSEANINPSIDDPLLSVVAVGDFNGDGHPDVLRQQLGHMPLNVVYLKNATVLGQASFNPDKASSTKAVTLGAPDLDGDGKPDILFDLDGQLSVWFMDGITRVGTANLNPSTGPSNKDLVVGNADFNVDGHTDILFENVKTGALDVWLMNTINLVTETATMPAKEVAPSWVIVAPR